MDNIPPSTPLTRRATLLGLVQGVALTALANSPASAFAQSPVATLPLATSGVTPFRVSVSPAAISDLHQRLRMTRLPEKETVSDWSQGAPLAKVQALIAYWRDHYDWKRFERRINSYPQFRTEIDGLGIHFLHVRSKHQNALPIIMTHGWPGSVVEFLDVIGPLTDPTAHRGRPEDAFHVVIPSLPGFGWSDKPKDTGWSVERTAKAWGVLMQRLGYDRWVAQGGDWGAGVTHALAQIRPAGVVAAHVNWQFVVPETLPANPTPEEQVAIDGLKLFTGDGYGYFREQATRPQTIGYALTDSPVGQAAWIYEKFQAWTDNRGNPEDALSMDQILDDISLYWFTDTAASSARFYWENARNGRGGNAGHIDLPMAATVFPHEIFTTTKAWAEKLWPNIIYWNKVDRGGHFAAFEQPKIFAEELWKAFRSVRQDGQAKG
jgi:pimeloyl-ACP methyl ester carboxylesterase